VGRTAFLFPGQGAQKVGMGADAYQSLPEARRIFDQADEILGFSLSKICFDGPQEKLNETDISQPAIFVTSVALAEAFTARAGKDIEPQAAAGLSLGEYTALWADGVRLTRRRGELMQAAAKAHPSTMAGIMGLDEEQVKNICEAASALGIISPANFNCPGQTVVSGTIEACRRAMELAEQAGGRAVELKVAGAFHSELMASAAQGLKQYLQDVALAELRMPVVANVTANYHGDPQSICSLLVSQLTRGILWQKSMEHLIGDGYDRFWEIGPGRVLRGLMKKIDRKASVTNINCAADIIG